jgi:Virus neck protein
MKNQYFSIGTRNEQMLFQNLVDEQIKMFGIDVYYLPRKYINVDKIFKDVNNSSFDDAYIIEAYINTFQGFQGQGDFMSKFGLKQSDELTLTISKMRYEDFITPFITNDPEVILPTRPSEGDLIYFPLTRNFFEIKFVEHEDPFYQVGKNYVYKLSCELYEYEGEEIDTTVDEIDRAASMEGYHVDYTMGSGTSNYQFNELVVAYGTPIGTGGTIGAGVTHATVAKWNGPSRILTLSHISGSFGIGQTLVGVSSGTGRTIIMFDYLGNTDDSFGDNREFENEADDILDFSESNPFGEYGHNNGMGGF